MPQLPPWSRLHHVTLNVQDVERSAHWYEQVLGFSRVTTSSTEQFDRVVLAHANGVILGLSRHMAPEAAEPFSESRAGLDHLAFAVADKQALDEWVAHFDRLDVPRSEIKPAVMPRAYLVVFRDPDGIQLEVFASPQE